MIEPWLAWRLLKFLGIGLFTAGLGATFSRAQSRRLWAVHIIATLGLGITWMAGFGLTKISGATIRDPWILTSLFASLLALHEAAAIAERPRVSTINIALMIAAYASSIGSMVARFPGTSNTLASFGIPGALGLLTLLILRWRPLTFDYDTSAVRPAVHRWFLWIARVEGASLVTLLLIYMPLKYAANIVLDGGQGWFGWFHGVMALIFLQALWSAWRRLEWSLLRAGLAFIASLLPFGTFIFERSLRPPPATDKG